MFIRRAPDALMDFPMIWKVGWILWKGADTGSFWSYHFNDFAGDGGGDYGGDGGDGGDGDYGGDGGDGGDGDNGGDGDYGGAGWVC